METAQDSEAAATIENVTESNEEDTTNSESAAEPRGGEESTAAVAESGHDAVTAEDKHGVDPDIHGDKKLENEPLHHMRDEQTQFGASAADLPDGNSQQQPVGAAESDLSLQHKDGLAEQQSAEDTQSDLEPNSPPLSDTAHPAASDVPEAATTNGAEQQDAAALPPSATHESSSDEQKAESVQHAPVHLHNTAANSSHAQQGSHTMSSNVQMPKHSSTEQHDSHHPSHTGSLHTMTCPPHKESAIERLTTPTAMRMLKNLEQTQGGKHEWHIATGVPFKSKQLSADELSAMVDRLCSPKHETDNMPPKPHAVKLAYEGNKEVLVPVKESSKEENIAYMSNLYERCQETRAKTLQTLQDKWLQPLGRPLRHTSSSK